jgi:voltage-gated potassium channel
LIVLAVVFRHRLISFIFRNILRSPVIIISLLLFIIVLIGSALLWIVEHATNPNFSTIPESVWSIFVYLFSGLEDRGPTTAFGKVVAIFIFLSGVSVMGMIYGRITAWLIKLENLKGGLMSIEQFDNHYIICNYSPKANSIIEELHSGVVKWRRIIVISEREHELTVAQSNDKRYTRDVIFASGSPYSVDMLRNADAQRAHSIIVLADEESPDPDGQSAMVCLAIEQLMTEVREKKPDAKKPHVVVEAVNHRTLEHLYYAGADEVISHTDFGLRLLSQAAITPHIGEIYNRLTSVRGDTNEIYIVRGDNVPSELIGKGYSDIRLYFAEYNVKNKSPVTPIGLVRDGGFMINPSGECEKDFGAFKGEDGIIFIAFEPPKFK